MKPTNEWLKKLESVREKTVCPVNFNEYFEQNQIGGKDMAVMNIGHCSIPSGNILVRDPLCYLRVQGARPYFLTATPGEYQTEVCVVKPGDDGDCARYAAVRIKFSSAPAVKFEEALIGDEDLKELEKEAYFGFCVDAGLACICDETLHKAFCDFFESWGKENPDGNIYDDYFAPLFAENYKLRPEFQREGGDWLNWTIPGTGYHMPIFQSGFGDGVYPVYWGYDSKGLICQLVVQFIDIKSAYGEEDSDE